MLTTLFVFYLLVTIAIGLWAARRGRNTADFAVAGRHLPLVAGLYWRRAATQGAVFPIVLGVLTWLLLIATPAGEAFPAQLAGLVMAVLGMVIGSLGPQKIKNQHGAHHRVAVA